MNAKTTTVTLVANGVTQDFEFAHAERILRMPNNGGWKLPEDSKFEFIDNGLQRRGNKKEDCGK
jgi:hypothetical protein